MKCGQTALEDDPAAEPGSGLLGDWGTGGLLVPAGYQGLGGPGPSGGPAFPAMVVNRGFGPSSPTPVGFGVGVVVPGGAGVARGRGAPVHLTTWPPDHLIT